MKGLIGDLLGTAIGPLTGKVWLYVLGGLAIVAFAVVQIVDNVFEDTIDTAKDAGASAAVSEGRKSVLQQSGAANEAGNQIRDDHGNARYVECVRWASDRTRANCERFRKQPVSD